MTTIHAGDCSTGCERCAQLCAERAHAGCIGTGTERLVGDDMADRNAPALVQGSECSALARFVTDDRGDLVDIEYLCRPCARANEPDDLIRALDWPAYDFGGSPAYCASCAELIDAA